MSGPAHSAVPDQGTVRAKTPPHARGAHFPFAFIQGFLSFIADRRDRLEAITYADLHWETDIDGASSYPEERRRFQDRSHQLATEGRAQLLIQHDVDARPHRTDAVLAEEVRLGIPTSVMIFNRRVDRQPLQRRGELGFTAYPLDEALYRRAEASGGLIGHHFNAMEQALWDADRARQILVDDVTALRERFDIKFVSAHGGARSPAGLKNRDLPPDDLADLGVRWVHNGMSPRFDGNYSDGGLNSSAIDPVDRDLRTFVESFRPGGRYRILLHPQYYATPFQPAPGLAGTPWYDDLLAAHTADPQHDSWGDVELAW